jgi:hypothetical protein
MAGKVDRRMKNQTMNTKFAVTEVARIHNYSIDGTRAKLRELVVTGSDVEHTPAADIHDQSKEVLLNPY